MTKEISTDAELISRLLTTRPTPAECLVAAARIEQLANATRATPAAMTPDAAALVQNMLRDGKLWRAAVNAASSVLNDGVPQQHWASPPKIRLALDAALAALREGRPA